MSKFFINRPIVAIVISIVMVILGTITIIELPVAQFPNIAPPEIQIQATYVGWWMSHCRGTIDSEKSRPSFGYRGISQEFQDVMRGRLDGPDV